MISIRTKLLLGGFFILMGVMIVMAAFSVGPMSGSGRHAPSWVIGVCGVVFAGGGVALVSSKRRAGQVGAGAVVVGLSMVFAWIALFGDARYFSGGSPILPRGAEVLIARVIFGAVAILGIAITLNGICQALRGRDDRPVAVPMRSSERENHGGARR